MIYLFDVDGTLTPSRGSIDPVFKTWFKGFAGRNRVSLVTGSDYEKTLEQLGKDVMDCVEYSFNCSGNAIYRRNKLIRKSEWQLPDDLGQVLDSYLTTSDYPHRFGNHIERRIGTVNFSIVGRSAVGQQRTDYYHWDQQHQEREKIATDINNRWPLVEAAVGGETGVDIFERGRDKSQVLDYLDSDVVFFGDRIDPNGNDYKLAKMIASRYRGTSYHVRDWHDTETVLRSIWPAL